MVDSKGPDALVGPFGHVGIYRAACTPAGSGASGRRLARLELRRVLPVAPQERRRHSAGPGHRVELPTMVHELVVRDVERDRTRPARAPGCTYHRRKLGVTDPLDRGIPLLP